MARKRQSIDAGVAPGLLARKVRLLDGTGETRQRLALDLLTGKRDIPAPRDDPTPALESVGRPNGPVRSRRRVVGSRSIYLDETALADIELLAQSLGEEMNHPVSRSALVRRAIGHMRRTLDSSARSTQIREDAP